MFRYNPEANYQPNGGRYLQILSDKDLYKQTIVVSSNDTFPARFPNIFVDYLLGQMHVDDKLWMHYLTFQSQGGMMKLFPYASAKPYLVCFQRFYRQHLFSSQCSFPCSRR